jgi:hypothetical protein
MKYLLNLFLLLSSIKGYSQSETFEKRTFTDKEGHILPYEFYFQRIMMPQKNILSF